MAVLWIVQFLFTTVLFQYVMSAASDPSNIYCKNESLTIVGGDVISIEDAPYMVALYVKTSNKSEAHGCGGSIIHERFVLTAAHCFLWENRTLQVLIGSDRLNTGGDFIDVEKTFCHKGFTFEELNHDICLLKLVDPVPFGCKVAKIELPPEDFELESGELVNVTGWGVVNNSATELSNDLRQVSVPMVSRECCRHYYNSLESQQICAGARGYDSCQGDSGGPLTYNGIQVGIVSYGFFCAINPGVYTNVASYLDWIQNIIDDNL